MNTPSRSLPPSALAQWEALIGAVLDFQNALDEYEHHLSDPVRWRNLVDALAVLNLHFARFRVERSGELRELL